MSIFNDEKKFKEWLRESMIELFQNETYSENLKDILQKVRFFLENKSFVDGTDLQTEQDALEQMNEEFLSAETDAVDTHKKQKEFEADETEEDLNSAAKFIPQVTQILMDAIDKKASFVYFQPVRDGVWVRYRMHGMLYEKIRLPKDQQDDVINGIKLMADMDIDESRIPQHGSISLKKDGERFRSSVCTLPTFHGERIRIAFSRPASPRPLDQLGLSPANIQRLRQYIHKQKGIILLAGPRHSGKTTTLYSILSELDPLKKDIISAESSLEHDFDNLSQMATRVEIGYPMSSLLNAAHKQFPDVIAGEIEDKECASRVVIIASTGTLVIASINAGDALNAVLRFSDMNSDPSFVDSHLLCVLAQRLARRICEHCRRPYQPDMDEYKALNIDPSEPLEKGTGCDHCLGSGYFGLIPLHEILVLNDTNRKLFKGKTPLPMLRKQLNAQDLNPFVVDGAKKVRQGYTTIEEVLTVISTL